MLIGLKIEIKSYSEKELKQHKDSIENIVKEQFKDFSEKKEQKKEQKNTYKSSWGNPGGKKR